MLLQLKICLTRNNSTSLLGGDVVHGLLVSSTAERPKREVPGGHVIQGHTDGPLGRSKENITLEKKEYTQRDSVQQHNMKSIMCQ